METIVPKWSKWINKGLTEKKVVKFYADCEKIGIKTGALFMFGFPEQTEAKLSEDINMLNMEREINLRIKSHRVF